MEPNDVFVFYRDSLKNAGLNETEYFHRPLGCIPFFDSEGVTFYQHEDRGPSLAIAAHTLFTEKENVSNISLPETNAPIKPGSG
jgi:hypothetical protein